MAASRPVELGPFQSIYDGDKEGVVRKELIIYRKDNQSLVRETATREYHLNGDYHDSVSSSPIFIEKEK
jgi:hypothetical protein